MSEAALAQPTQGRLRAGGRALLFVVLIVVLASVATVILRAVAVSPGDGPIVHWTYQVAPFLGLVVGGLAAHWVMLRFVDHRPWSYVDLDRTAFGIPRLGVGLALGGLAVGVPCLVLLAAHWLVVEPSPVQGLSTGAETVAALALLIPAALAEELMMRGYLLSALGDAIGRWGALLATSVVFALLHVRNPGMTPGALTVVALAGIFLGALRYATSSLYAAWAAHFAWNAVLGVAFHALVSGQTIAHDLWRTVDSGPDWITGGNWGPEGGVAAALGLAAATFLIIRRPRFVGTRDLNVTSHA